MRKKRYGVGWLAVLLTVVGLMASPVFGAVDFGENITVFDGYGRGSGWNGVQEDNEVEIGVQSQLWDLEAWVLDGNTLTAIGGFDFVNGVPFGGARIVSGDIWFDLHGTRGNTNLPGFGYTYVLDMDFESLAYTIYDCQPDLTVDLGWSRTGLEPWIGVPYRRRAGGTPIGTGDIFVHPPMTSPDLVKYGLIGDEASDVHYAISVDISFLQGAAFFVHMTQTCRNDFLHGESGYASIGDFVWYDANRNGIQDEGEPGIEGVEVQLYDTDGNLLRTAITGPNGYYLFANLSPNVYVVWVNPDTLPPGYEPTIAFAGDDTELDSNGPDPVVVDVRTVRDDLSIDFGYVSACTGMIGDFVWHDVNRNGIQDEDEPGIPYVIVNLLDAEGYLVATTTTDEDGYYEFVGLCAGTYQVQVETDSSVFPVGFTPTMPFMGGDPALDSNGPLDGSPAIVVLTTDNAVDLTIDFGYVSPLPGSIGDFVWHDLNRNGIQDPGEPGLGGVTVNLFDCETGELLESTTTDPDGYYLFSDLLPGNYAIQVEAPDGYVFSPANQGGDSERDSDADANGHMPCTALAAGQNDLSWDAGLYRPQTDCIGTGTPGYWKTHCKAWPVNTIVIGGVCYTKTQAIRMMWTAPKGDMRYVMFRALVAAKLNVLIGNDDSCIADTIAAADAWWRQYRGSIVRASSAAWKIGEPLYQRLDAYNNGLLCAPSRDACEKKYTKPSCGSKATAIKKAVQRVRNAKPVLKAKVFKKCR